MRFLHLTSSRFFGGPERQMLGLARTLPSHWQAAFASFGEGGGCDAFLDVVRQVGFPAHRLMHDTPHLLAARKELTALLRRDAVDVLLCHGYKADLVGRPSARAAGIPVIAVSRGWTGEDLKVRFYERIDRLLLRHMDRVVCVSEGQAVKVRAAGVPAARVRVIRNSARADAFRDPNPADRHAIEKLFPDPGRLIVLSAGRLSPDKGFDVLVAAIPTILESSPDARFVICGEGGQRDELRRQIEALGLSSHVVLAGFRDDLDDWMPNADLFVLPSYNEGLPNVVLEAHAAGVPAVATAVGGTPEVLLDGETGWLVPPGDSAELAARIGRMLAHADVRRRMGAAARARVRDHFTFATQARQYVGLFEELVNVRCAAA